MHQTFRQDSKAESDLPGDAQEPIVSDRFNLPEEGNIVGQIQVVHSRYQDTLFALGRHFGLGIDELTEANPGVDRWIPGENTAIVLPTQFVLPNAPRSGIVLNIATKRLFYYPEPGDELPMVLTHPVGVGRVGWQTPTGTSKIIAKSTNPSWYVPKSIREEHAANGDPLPAVVPPGPDNPLGEYVLRLSMPSYLIHGTNKPAGVGMRVSHGCVRLYPEDIEPLFESVSVGTPVAIVNQPYLVGWKNGNIYLEAHKPFEDDQRDLVLYLVNRVNEIAQALQIPEEAIDWKKVGDALSEPRGFPIPILQGSPDTETLLLSARVIKRPTVFRQDQSEETEALVAAENEADSAAESSSQSHTKE